MKKKYISPETTLIKVRTENMMSISEVRMGNWNPANTESMKGYGLSDGIEVWKGSDQPECIGRKEGFGSWDDEE